MLPHFHWRSVRLGGTGEGRKGAGALVWGGMAMLLGEAGEEEEAVLMRRQEGEGDISEEGEGRGWVTGLPGVWGQYRQLLVLIERLSPLAGNPARPIYVWGEEGTRLGEAPPYTYGIVDSSDGCAEGPM